MISIIVPVFNEEGSLSEFNKLLFAVVNVLDRPYEIIYVDDGSADNSYDILVSIAKEHDSVHVLSFNKNYGQTLAFKAGLDYSKGDIIVFIDSDLQNDPADIPRLLEKIEEGYDIVSGWRKRRKDNLITKVIPSLIANKLISCALGLKLHDMGCSLKAYRRRVLQDIDFYGEMHRIIPIYAFNNGAKITEVVVKHDYRKKGISKYGISRIFKLLLDVVSAHFTSKYFTRPLYFFGFLGLWFLLFGAFSLMAIILRVFLFKGIWISPLLFISIMLFLIGSQVILMGILAEVLMKLYYKRELKYPYIINKKIENKIEKVEST